MKRLKLLSCLVLLQLLLVIPVVAETPVSSQSQTNDREDDSKVAGNMGSGILSARLSWRISVGSSPTQVKLSQQPATEAASYECGGNEADGAGNPVDRRCWAAT